MIRVVSFPGLNICHYNSHQKKKQNTKHMGASESWMQKGPSQVCEQYEIQFPPEEGGKFLSLFDFTLEPGYILWMENSCVEIYPVLNSSAVCHVSEVTKWVLWMKHFPVHCQWFQFISVRLFNGVGYTLWSTSVCMYLDPWWDAKLITQNMKNGSHTGYILGPDAFLYPDHRSRHQRETFTWITDDWFWMAAAFIWRAIENVPKRIWKYCIVLVDSCDVLHGSEWQWLFEESSTANHVNAGFVNATRCISQPRRQNTRWLQPCIPSRRRWCIGRVWWHIAPMVYFTDHFHYIVGECRSRTIHRGCSSCSDRCATLSLGNQGPENELWGEGPERTFDFWDMCFALPMRVCLWQVPVVCGKILTCVFHHSVLRPVWAWERYWCGAYKSMRETSLVQGEASPLCQLPMNSTKPWDSSTVSIGWYGLESIPSEDVHGFFVIVVSIYAKKCSRWLHR